MGIFDNLNPSEIEYFNKLIVVKQVLSNYKNKDVINKIIEFYYIIEQEYVKFKYVYDNIRYINYDINIVRNIKDLSFDLVTISPNKSILQYNLSSFNKFIYIISIAVNFNIDIEIVQIIINKYLSKIIKYGNIYQIINACLLSFNTKIRYNDIIINYDYYEGLIKCLQLSPRWDENVLYFHNKQLLNKFNLREVFVEVSKYLLTKNHNYSCDIITELFGDKSDFILQ